MTLAKAKARANDTFIVQAYLTIVTHDCQKKFIVQAIGQAVQSTIFEMPMVQAYLQII
jgi:hypothetical protein